MRLTFSVNSKVSCSRYFDILKAFLLYMFLCSIKFVIFLTETISRTDEGQPRPKYIFNKCGTFFSTEVWSIISHRILKKHYAKQGSTLGTTNSTPLHVNYVLPLDSLFYSTQILPIWRFHRQR